MVLSQTGNFLRPAVRAGFFILELRNLGWGQDEIGAALGISQSAVSSAVIASRKTKNGKTDR